MTGVQGVAGVAAMSGTDLAVALVVGLVALAVSVAGGWPLTGWVLRRAVGHDGRVPDSAGAAEGNESGQGAHGQGEAGEPGASVLRGGTWIGVLERLAITGSILLAYPQAIAVVIAIKGLGRFPELRAAAAGASASERFIIGTLTSFCWAGAVGAAARFALSTLG